MEENLEDYFKTTYKERLPAKQSEGEDEVIAPPMQLVEKRREMAAAEQALNIQKEEFQQKMQSLREQKKILDKKEHHLKEYLLKFEKFVKENQAKKLRAEKRAQTEKTIRQHKEKDIERMEAEIAELQEQKDIYQEKIEKNAIYFQYMEKIVEVSDEFSEIRDVMARYETLINTQLDLINKDQGIQESIEEEKSKTNETLGEKNNKILHYNNKLAKLQAQHDQSSSELSKWESKWVRLQNTATEKTLSLGKMKIAAHNLFQLVNKHARQPASVTVEDTNCQLEKIQSFIQDLDFIVTELRHRPAT